MESILKSVPVFPRENICTDEESPLSEDIPPHARVIHVGVPPLIERTCPFDPLMSPMVSPTRESPLLNVRAFSFVLKIFQSVAESAPERDDDARVRERICPERESPVDPERVTGACD